mmetsp:Transcript_25719/g.46989  ORF Transcript_25719/g.46989 Transcript_25719/m.46989 type:complete len:766 (-) Transcript_25719:69-2366(-)
MIRFEVECHTEMGQSVAVCGGAPLGDWDVSDAKVLDPSAYPQWCGEVPIDSKACLDFKYVLVSTTAGAKPSLIRWEYDAGTNRRVEMQGASKVIRHDKFGDPSLTSSERWEASSSEACGATSSDARERTTSGMLQKVAVEPHVRATRLIRSRSGLSFSQKYEVQGDVLGKGMSGSVRTAKNRSTGLEVALKTLSISGLADKSRALVLAEVENAISMDHPNICRLLEVYEEPDQLRLVMERMRGPDVFESFLRKGKYSESDASGCIYQMFSAVAYCHKRGVCHRDLKMENFCLASDADDAQIKLIDFGLSAKFDTAPMSDAVGTLYYVAPEVLSGGDYNEKCDVWSMGVITYIMLSGKAPFQGRTDQATYKLIVRGQVQFTDYSWGYISTEGKDFIKATMCKEVAKRLSSEACLSHDWIVKEKTCDQSNDLHTDVLQGLRGFVKSNVLKRAVLTAVAPVATVGQVQKWASEFQALDVDGTGFITCKALTEQFKKTASEAEAKELEAALKNVEEGEEISYTAFLAVCLSGHLTLGDEEVREIFDRFDVNKDGILSEEEILASLSDLVGAQLEELQEQVKERGLTFEDFKRILLGPRVGCGLAGLEGLLKLAGEKAKSWRVDTARARKAAGTCSSVQADCIAADATPDERLAALEAPWMEAARRENLAWRQREAWGRTNAPTGSRQDQPRRSKNIALEVGEAISFKPLQDTPKAAGDEKLIEGSPVPAEWAIATLEAKDGDPEAVRREYHSWRVWNKKAIAEEQKAAT